MKKALFVYSLVIAVVQVFLCRVHQLSQFTYERLYRGYIPQDGELPGLTQFAMKAAVWPYLLPLGLLAASIILVGGRMNERILLHVLASEVVLFLFLFVVFGIAYILPFVVTIGTLK